MVSIYGFLNSLKDRFSWIKYIEGLSGKIDVFVSDVFYSIPKTIRNKSSVLNSIVTNVADRLMRNKIANVDSTRYVLIDLESLRIISPEYEYWMWKYLKLKTGEVFLDIGAHVGKYSFMASKIVGRKGLVIAVEPHPLNFYCLIKGIQLNNLKNVIPLNIAAWDKNQKIKLFIGEASGGHSLIKNSNMGYIDVEGRRLDDVLKDLNINRVDWIKIDAEGVEIKVIKGLKETIRKCRPRIIVESWRKNSPRFLKYMKTLGYVCESFDENQTYYYCTEGKK